MRSVVDDCDVLLTVLAADLDELLGRVAGVVDRLHGAGNPSRSHRQRHRGRVARIARAASEYDDVRRAQELVILDAPTANHPLEYIDDPMAYDLCFATSTRIIPTWREADNRFVMQGSPPDRRPWPINDELAQLVWLITSAAEVWLPTSTQLARLHTERRNRNNPAPAGNPRADTRSTLTIR